MDGEHNQYATLSRRQVALFERNPVCALCYRLCMDMCEEYGGINFELLDSIVLADNLCEQILQDPWNLNGVEYYSGWVRNRLGNSQPAIVCTFATTCVTLSCIEGLPEHVYQLAHDLRGLITGEGNDLYYNLSSAAYRQDIVIDATAYGEPQPDPLERMKELTNERINELTNQRDQLSQQVQIMSERINELTNEHMKNQQTTGGTTIHCQTYVDEIKNDIHDNHNCSIYAVPTDERLTSERVSELASERVKGDSRTKKLFMTDGAEDLERTEGEKNRFLNYLAEHHLGQRQVDCYKDNPINKAIVCFCVKWKRLRYIDKPSPAAVYRFLTETCHLECAAETDAITASLGRLLKADYDKETFYDVENYF